jgi:hypothetical protein
MIEEPVKLKHYLRHSSNLQRLSMKRALLLLWYHYLREEKEGIFIAESVRLKKNPTIFDAEHCLWRAFLGLKCLENKTADDKKLRREKDIKDTSTQSDNLAVYFVDGSEVDNGAIACEFMASYQAACNKDIDNIDFDLLQHPLALISVLERHMVANFSSSELNFYSRILLEENEESFYVGRRDARRTKIGKHENSLETYLRHHFIIPQKFSGFKVSMYRNVVPTTRGLDMHNVISSAASFDDGVVPQLKLDGEASYSPGVTCEHTRNQSVGSTLEKAAAKSANILVFPELTITPTQTENIQEWLYHNRRTHNFKFVHSGGYHLEDGHSAKRHNRVQLMDCIGEPILTHHKIKGAPNGGYLEAIEPKLSGDKEIEINLLLSNLGVAATPICYDFIDEERSVDIWKRLCLDWAFVSAMDNPATPHIKKAELLFKKHKTTTVAAIQPFPFDITTAGLDKADNKEQKVDEIYQEYLKASDVFLSELGLFLFDKNVAEGSVLIYFCNKEENKLVKELDEIPAQLADILKNDSMTESDKVYLRQLLIRYNSTEGMSFIYTSKKYDKTNEAGQAVELEKKNKANFEDPRTGAHIEKEQDNFVMYPK